MLFFEEMGKPEYPEKNLSRQRQDENAGYIGERRVLSPLGGPLLLPPK